MSLTPEEIEELNAAHDDIVKPKGTVIAIRAGELLTKAKAGLSKDEKWAAWLKANCPKIAPSTDRLYRLFFEKKADLERKAGGANALALLTVSEARDLLATDEQKAKRGAAKEKAKAKREENKAKLSATVSPTLHDLANEANDPKEVLEAFDPEVWEADDLDTAARGLMDLAQQVRSNENHSDTPPLKSPEKTGIVGLLRRG